MSTTAPTGGGAATSVLTRHYTDSGDNPSWVDDTVNATSTRYGKSLGGDLSAQAVTTAGTTQAQVSLSDLHGDSIATTTLPGSGNATSIDAWSDYTEYGAPRDPVSTRAISSQAGYGWLGAKQRATDLATGLVLMGARLYNNLTGRFTTTDPVPAATTTPTTTPTTPST